MEHALRARVLRVNDRIKDARGVVLAEILDPRAPHLLRITVAPPVATKPETEFDLLSIGQVKQTGVADQFLRRAVDHGPLAEPVLLLVGKVSCQAAFRVGQVMIRSSWNKVHDLGV